MKNFYTVFVCICLICFLVACNDTNTDEPMNNMPNEMPADFAFKVQFGVDKKNEINTFDGTVTKDLIADGVTSMKLELAENEKKKIYEKMKAIQMTEEKQLIPKSVKGTVCMKEPHEDDAWEIRLNGEMFTLEIPGAYCEPTNDVKELLALRNEVFRLVKLKEIYQALPEPSGGYD